MLYDFHTVYLTIGVIMIYNMLLVLALLDRANGGGVGLAAVCRELSVSKFKARNLLKEMCNEGLIVRQGNVYRLLRLGANIAVADVANFQGYGVALTECEDYMPVYQKKGL